MHHPVPLPARTLLSARYAHLAPLERDERAALDEAERGACRKPPRHELLSEGAPIRAPQALLSGWALHQRFLHDGRRQILSVLLPGDLIGRAGHSRPIATASVAAATAVETCVAPPAAPGSALEDAYAHAAALDQHYILAQITRLGRFNAYERLADWLLETRERLAAVARATADSFVLPLTQEAMADLLGLTSVHVNRTLRAMRSDGMITWHRRTITLPGRERLAALVGYRAPRISAAAGGAASTAPARSPAAIQIGAAPA